MGINYYWIGVEQRHVGKKSFAGKYCWDCGVYFLKAGTNYAHAGNEDWWLVCPECGKEGSEVSSFTWKKFSDYTTIQRNLNRDEPVIEDENGNQYTYVEFQVKVLNYCPLPLFRQLYAEFY